MQTLAAHRGLAFAALTHFRQRVILAFSPGGERGGAVELSTERPIDLNAVKAICRLPDDLYRLRWVSYAYYDIANRLAVNFGQNASWPAFARWSAYTISEALRLDRVNPRLEEVLREYSLPERVTGPLVAIQRQLRSLDDGAMPTVLALGNRLVFHEVAYTMVEFLDWIENPERNPATWEEYKEGIAPFESTDFFRPGDLEQLRDGMSAYYDAWVERDPTVRAQHVLRGNILIGAYEQWRVDSFFEVALDFNPGALITDLRIGKHDDVGTRPVGVRYGGTRRALRHQWAMLNWMSDAYATFLTRFVMTWDAPLFGARPTALRLGCDIPSRRRAAVYSCNLEEEQLSDDVKKLIARFDRSGGRLQGSGARNFRRFTDRMSFIVNLFRSQQQNQNLTVPPSFAERRLLELQLNDRHLDQLRGIGDKLDNQLTARVEALALDPQEIARGFVMHGEPYDILRSNEEVEIDVPEWIDAAKIRAGQEFFERHQMDIAAALFCASLPMAYTAARGARVLVETAALVSDVNRRIAETARMLVSVMIPEPEVDPLTPASRGYTTALTVRGFHAAIRRMLKEREPWKSAWTVPMTRAESEGEDAIAPDQPRPEVPINQEDMLGTLTTFTVVVIESLTKMGIKVSDEERDAYLHAWLVVGHLLGIDYDLLRAHPFNKKLEPLTYFEMQLVRDAIFRRHAAASPSGQILARALLGVQEAALPRVLRPLPPAAIRRFIGDYYADLLEVPPAGPVRVALDALGPFGTATDWIAQGRVIRPQLADMAAHMFQNWEEQGGWSPDGLDPAYRLKPQIDLTEAAHRVAEAPPLWANENATLPLSDAGTLTSTQ
jgi:hypothetical protein